MTRKKAVVAMSGGVDSSVSAALLVEQGYDVTGIMLKLWKGEAANNNSGCCNLGAAEDARRVADRLGIPFYVFNFADLFERTVISDFQATYAAGATPNPCIRCNQWIKFDALLERADALGADVLATGHYARVEKTGSTYAIRRGLDARKDQSYVLWMLTQKELARCTFPVGGLEKSQTRAIASELGLRTAAKPDSQEICFVRNGDTAAYLQDAIPEAAKPGPIRDRDGEVVGQHGGIGRYTIGQRKGLGVALGTPRFVTAIDPDTNSIFIGPKSDLEVEALRTTETSWVERSPSEPATVTIQYRAHGETRSGRVRALSGGRAEVRFDRPALAVARGQSAAFYDGDRLIGGGIIEETLASATSAA